MDNEQLTIHAAIEQNRWKEALELINKAQPDELNATNELGQAPLHLAVAAEHLDAMFSNKRSEIINALIERGANVNAQDKDGETAVHYISRRLLNDGNDKKVKSKIFYNSMKFLDHKLISSLECLITGKADVNIESNKGDTALDHILKHKKYNASKACNTIETLLSAGSQIKTEEQAFVILRDNIKSKESSLETVKLVTSQPAFKVNYKDKEGNTALSLAYKKEKKEGKFDLTKFFIEKGADPKTIIPSTGKSFMTHVIEENLFKFVPSLKFDVVLENGLSPLAIAVNSNNYDSVKLLIDKHKADVNFSDGYGRKAIHYAAAGGNTEIVKYLISHGADVNSLDGSENTLLHYAAANRDGNENIAFLIKKGIGVNCEDSSGVRPIRLAIARNNLNNFQTLLNNGASLEMKDFEGVKSISPFIVVVALMRNHPITQNLLKDERVKVNDVLKLQYDYNPDEKKDLGTILHWAVKNNKNEVIDILKPYIKSEHVNLESEYGNMSLHSAVAYNNITMVRSLLEVSNINVNVPNRWHARSIELAKSVDMILMLVNTGADIESEKGKRDLTGVINNLIEKEKSEEVIKLLSDELLKDKIDLNAEAWYGDNDDGTTILEAATLKYNTKLLKVLSKHRPSANLKGINEPHYQDLIMCHLAEKHSKTQDKAEKNKIKDTMILLVLLFNADLTLTDKHGKKPLDYLNDQKLKKYLEEDVVKLRDNINKICGTSATDFILNYFEQNPDQSIESCVKDLSKNLKPLMDEYARNTDNPSTSFNTAKVEKRVRIIQLCSEVES
ncbi:MAG: ankyrin repeat domain-containing protein [Wolbachia endosymbiont of Xenopsylla cheopis]